MVALSVSISAKISPSSTLSPTFFNHEATVPSSMVSLSLGIAITFTPSGIDVVVVSETVSSGETSFEGSSGVTPFKIPEISSPSSPIIARRTSTGDVSPS